MRVPNCAFECGVHQSRIQKDLFKLDVPNGRERNDEIARIFDIDDDFRSAARRYLAHGANRFVSVVQEDVETFLDLFVKHGSTPMSGPDMPMFRAEWKRQ